MYRSTDIFRVGEAGVSGFSEVCCCKEECMSPLRSGLKRTETEKTRLRVNTGNYKVCMGLNPIKSDVVGFPEYCSTFQ